MNRAAVVLTVALGVAGCAMRVTGIETPAPQRSRVTGTCLALSGGGLRSGAVSLGVLQQLHSAGELERLSYISTVSGGGYPVYGLAYRVIKDGAQLGDLLAEDGKHIRHADANAEFVGGKPLLAVPLVPFWALLSSLTPYSAAQPTYSAKIHRTFAGGLIPLWGHPKLHEWSTRRTAKMPVLIFGASAKAGSGAPRVGYPYEAADYFEMATDLSGSPHLGYYPSFGRELELREAATISGAAIDSPDGGVPDLLKAIKVGLGTNVSLPRSDKRVKAFLSDAGFVENLGILPLLRRGCTDILAFDNTHDPDGAFRSWMTFIVRADEEGWTLKSDLTSDEGKTLKENRNGWNLATHKWYASMSKDDATARIQLIKLGIDSANFASYPLTVRAFIGGVSRAQQGCSGSGLGLRCSFPLEATQRQSFSVGEFRAYRHLGRCLAERALNKEAYCQ